MTLQDDAAARAVDDIRGDATAREERPAAARDALAAVALPVGNLNEALPHLRRPFSPAAIRFKVQAAFPKGNPQKAVIVAYIDARLVIERLNAVVGGAWAAEYAAVAAKDTLLRCDLTVFGVTRRDVGESTKKMSKDLISDALKRAAVHFGVGVSVYALPQVTWRQTDHPAELEPRGEGDKKTLALTDRGHARLRGSYEEWLEAYGSKDFGPALDHGDVLSDVDAEAMVALDGEEAFEPAPPPELTDERAEVLKERARAAYTAISADATARRSFAPATFQAWLTGAWHSHEELERLVAHVEQRRVELVG